MDGGLVTMMFYIEDEHGTVIAKFDGVNVDLRENDQIVEVDSHEELNQTTVKWIDYYNR